ncbi:methylglutaconyl-CoA hydratase, mitochondrial [Lycorma delicatula]|uniref:methylglutaconyl-CoA hydratase, mitochondrial n=1 Tax=Lycorma delicatula TaxID=130591 RepID=UPI003F518242
MFCLHQFLKKFSSPLFRSNDIPKKSIRYLQGLKQSFPQQEVVLDVLEKPYKGITVLGLNKTSSKNSLSKSLIEQFNFVLENIECSERTRVLILRSLVPRVFCAGADLKERLEMTHSEVHLFVSKLRSLTTDIENLPVPVIAAIDGAALGGGLEIALACDLRICSDNVKLGLVETKLGIIPGAGGTQRLPRIVGPAIAKELIFTGRIINGSEAKHLGIVNHVVQQNVDGDAAFQKSLLIAQEIIPNGPLGVQMAKIAINKGLEVDINSGCIIEENCYARVIPTKDRIEGLLAFKEKRSPNYKGE